MSPIIEISEEVLVTAMVSNGRIYLPDEVLKPLSINRKKDRVAIVKRTLRNGGTEFLIRSPRNPIPSPGGGPSPAGITMPGLTGPATDNEE